MAFDDHAVAKRIANIWDGANRHADLNFSLKHDVASMTADYLVRHKTRLDADNPLFKERSREAERVVVAVTQIVNATANAASVMKARNIEAAKLRKKNQPQAPRPTNRRTTRGSR